MQDCLSNNVITSTARRERELSYMCSTLERTLSGSHASCSGAANGREGPSNHLANVI